MDADRFDRIARSLTASPTRRGIIYALAWLTLGGLRGPAGTGAQKKKRKGKGKGKGKKKRGQSALPSPTCTDGTRNGNETGVDCGGPDCPRCANGQGCVDRADCASAICTNGICQACPTFGAPCGADADGNCYCEMPLTGPVLCFKTDEENTVETCSMCAADTTCTNISLWGFVDCRKLCGAQ